jgi:hypothetical protein
MTEGTGVGLKEPSITTGDAIARGIEELGAGVSAPACASRSCYRVTERTLRTSRRKHSCDVSDGSGTCASPMRSSRTSAGRS